MSNRLYVANIPFAATSESLSDYFSQAGAVSDVQIMIDKMTGRPRGFGFVTMAGDAEAKNAISMFHGKPFEGRSLTVTEARPREERPAGNPRRETVDGRPAAGAPEGERRSFSSSSGGGGGGGRGGERRGERHERDRDRDRDRARSERRDRRDTGGGSRRFALDETDDSID